MVAAEVSDHAIGTSSSSEEGGILNLADDEGWEDLEPDLETMKVQCLLCDMSYDDVVAMLQHCCKAHALDIVDVQKKLALDFMGMIKLVNYIRGQFLAGNGAPNLSTSAAFEDDRYLQPALEDDPLLYSLHDVIGEEFDKDEGGVSVEIARNGSIQSGDGVDRTTELEEKLQRAHKELLARKRELEAIKLHFGAPADHEPELGSIYHEDGFWKTGTGSSKDAAAFGNTDSSYFASYSGHEIHETMLKDTVRTDAYRDFIYENKHLFEGKTVLDVGCGTGILSMFCARAGAAKVIAVDNSDIINFARENVYKNGMGETISCLRGKIEEVVLPVKAVDIIVSEWMGYCLLYEAMLDSVLWARDHYLKADGLMIPSHCTLQIAPLTDAEYIDDHIHHWKNVYGFDMISMHKDIYNDVMIREVQDFAVPADSAPFLRLALKDTTTEGLTFEGKQFRFELKADMEALDGFVIWFDTFFLTRPDGQVSPAVKAEDCKRQGGESIAFTTGPHGKRTHWQQGVLLIDYRGSEPKALKKGQVIEGSIGYKKRQEDNRALDIDVQWHVDGDEERGKQSWSMR